MLQSINHSTVSVDNALIVHSQPVSAKTFACWVDARPFEKCHWQQNMIWWKSYKKRYMEDASDYSKFKGGGGAFGSGLKKRSHSDAACTSQTCQLYRISVWTCPIQLYFHSVTTLNESLLDIMGVCWRTDPSVINAPSCALCKPMWFECLGNCCSTGGDSLELDQCINRTGHTAVTNTPTDCVYAHWSSTPSLPRLRHAIKGNSSFISYKDSCRAYTKWLHKKN